MSFMTVIATIAINSLARNNGNNNNNNDINNYDDADNYNIFHDNNKSKLIMVVMAIKVIEKP